MSQRTTAGISVVAGLLAAVALIVSIVALMEEAPERDAPTKEEPGAYTKMVVEDAIERYESTGMQATIDYYNDPANVDGQWYVFIINRNTGRTVAHYNPIFRDRDPDLRVDATGYFYGDELLGATEDGRWVDYVLLNPDTEDDRQKHTWAVRHDDLLFGSGWYEG